MGFFPKVLKALNSHSAPVLARMFNLSLQTAQFPEEWRRAIITPVAKSPRTTDPRQFRPISLTSVVCKILETILKEKLLSHLSQLSLLTTRQHVFLPRRSTVTNLLSVEEKVTRWFDEGDTVNIVYLGFAKAFDSVNHRLLLTQLKCYEIAPSVINWSEPYPRRRSFQVSANGPLSQVAEVVSGVPQGSVLGPILFVICVNDLTDNLTIDHLLYADDVKLIAPPRKQLDALQSSLLACSKWSEDWELILNPSKSEHLPVEDTSNPVTYSFTSRTSSNAQPIQTAHTVHDIGLIPKTGFSADDNVARATKKSVECFLPKAILRNPYP